MASKGQIVSKGLFGILGFFKKTNEQIRFLVLLGQKNEFVCSFFGKIRGYQKPLYTMTLVNPFALMKVREMSIYIFVEKSLDQVFP